MNAVEDMYIAHIDIGQMQCIYIIYGLYMGYMDYTWGIWAIYKL